MASKYAPVISSTGVTANDFATNLAYLKADFQAIYGADIYLENDSQDGQLIGVLAEAFTDLGNAVVAVYNAYSPATAQGTGLSSNVKLNGLARLIPTYSTISVTIIGQAGITITNGQVTDVNQNVWGLPTTVQIPSSGTITVTATCTTLGAITGAPGAATISTPTYGWQTAVFASTAVPGSVVETDAALRNRQEESVALPSQTIFEGIVASIRNLTGVTRATGYENNTGSTNALGIPRNTLYFVVEGGTPAAIWAAIAAKITPGIGTQGSQSTTVTDSTGSTRLINYDTPANATISVVVVTNHLNGWASTTPAIIAQALVTYINSLPIGTNISYTGMIIPAYLVGTQYAGTFTIASMTLKKNSGAAASADVTINYNEAPIAALTNITVT